MATKKVAKDAEKVSETPATAKKTATKKTRKVTFNKVNYPRLVAFNLHKRKNMKVKRVNP